MTDATRETYEITSHPLVQISYQLKKLVDFVGSKGAYFILPLIAFTMIDFTAVRKTIVITVLDIWIGERGLNLIIVV